MIATRTFLHRSMIALAGVAATLLLATGCSGGEVLYARSKGADMPIWVRGNVGSGVLIVANHGGPGETSFAMPPAPAFQQLEARYGVAYWEQRSSGSAQGNATVDTLTLAQFTEDLGLVVDILRQRHPGTAIYLLGYSFGGLLTANYITDPASQGKVKGWIDLEGSHDIPLTIRAGRERVIGQAKEFVAAGRDAKLWQDALDWYERTPTIDETNILVHIGYVQAAERYTHRRLSAVGFGTLFSSPFDPLMYAANARHVLEPVFRDIKNVDVTDRLRQVTMPALVVFGGDDGNVPVAVGQEAFGALATPADSKRLLIVDGATHSLYLEFPDAFSAAVIDFIDRTR